MAMYLRYHPWSSELVDGLVSLIEPPDLSFCNPGKMDMILDASIAQMKIFFRSYYHKIDYDEPHRVKDKVAFWEKFIYHVLTNEMMNKPSEMDEEEFLFDVKFRQYSIAARDIVLSNNIVW